MRESQKNEDESPQVADQPMIHSGSRDRFQLKLVADYISV